MVGAIASHGVPVRSTIGRFTALVPLVLGVAALRSPASAQAGTEAAAPKTPRRLFHEDAPLAITLSADFRAVFGKRDTINPPKYPAQLTFQGDSGPMTVPVELSTRGHFRLKPSTCGFAPLKVHFPKDQLEGTVFGGERSLKLITHCEKGARYEQNLLVEYGTYRAYNQLTDLSHRARLARITYADTRDSSRTITRYGFFLEDDKDMAARNGGRVLEHAGGSYSEMDSAQMDLLGVFEWLIGNTDWSVVMNHNVRLVQFEDGRRSTPWRTTSTSPGWWTRPMPCRTADFRSRACGSGCIAGCAGRSRR